MKKLISGLLALTLAASGTAVAAGAIAAPTWRPAGDFGSETTSVKLKWNPVTGANGYRVYRFDVAKDKYVTVKTVSGGSKAFLNVAGLKPGTAYKFVIKAYKYSNNEQTFLSKKSAVAVASTKPTSTSITSKTRSSANAVRVFWNKYPYKNEVDKGSNYKFGGYKISVYNKNTDDFDDVATVSGGRTNVKLVGCKKNTKYTWKVTPFTVTLVGNSKKENKGDESKAYTIKTKNYWCNC